MRAFIALLVRGVSAEDVSRTSPPAEAEANYYAGGQHRLDGGVERAVVSRCPLAGDIHALGAVALGQRNDGLRGTQPLGDPVREQPVDQLGAVRADAQRLLMAPAPVVAIEGAGVGLRA